jgi:hypothetical protein
VAAPAPVGVTAELLGSGMPMLVRRVWNSRSAATTLAPGGTVARPSHPGAIVIFVEAGTWGYTALGGTAQLTRAAVGRYPDSI